MKTDVCRVAVSPRHRRRLSPRFLHLLAISWFVLLLGKTVHVARAEEDGSLPLPTAGARLLSTVFSADAQMELPLDEDVYEVADFQWKRLMNMSHRAPFLLCARSGRKGYREMLKGFNQTFLLPIFANRSMSCQVIHTSASTLLDATATMTWVTFGTPVFSVLKISKDLRERVNSGAFFEASAPSLRLVLGPGTEQRPGGLANVLRRLVRALRSGQYVQVVETDFEWSTVGNSTAQRQRRRRLTRQQESSRRGLMHMGAHDDDEEDGMSHTDRINGANYWEGHLLPVLDGDLKCNFEGVLATMEDPYLRLGGFEDLVTPHDEDVAHGQHYSNSTCPAASACLMTLLAFVGSDPDVLYVEEYPSIQLHNAVAAYITQSGEGPQGSLPFHAVGLDGSGQVVAVTDTGLDQRSCFFRDPTGPMPGTDITTAAFNLNKRKVVQYVVWGDSTDVANGHGTHVVGTLLGVSNDPVLNMSSFLGIAPGAKVAFYDLTDSSVGPGLRVPSNLNTRLFPPGFAAGARLFSNSWGTGEGMITSLDIEVDRWMYTNDETLVVFSAGNGAALGFSSVFSPALSKNAMSVGASENERGSGYNRGNVAYFSSLGPTSDGRIKPDVVAPGRVLASAAALATCGTTLKQGTSMATPVVSGSAAIVRQYFLDGWYPSGVKTTSDGFRPTGALVKATLINSAVPMKAFRFLNNTLLPLGLPPDAYQGHGRIKLDEVLKVRDIPSTASNLWVADNVTLVERERHWYKFSIPKKAAVRNESFKVTLVWVDPQTTASSAAVVLHNLDLLVQTHYGNKKIYPNGLSGPDNRNTVEKVVIYDPQPGDTLTVTVVGTSIATQPAQQYALVASGGFVSGAWFCQFPRITRTNDFYTTENCYATCDVYPKNPICCGASASTMCSAEEAAAAEADGLVCDPDTKPLECPTPAPTPAPTPGPTMRPTLTPTSVPSLAPSRPPSRPPTSRPTRSPTRLPTQTPAPTREPTRAPTQDPTRLPTSSPTPSPTRLPTSSPTSLPTRLPTRSPTSSPTATSFGLWYCQFPRITRLNDAYTTQNCAAICDGRSNLRKPRCCPVSAGSVCSDEEYAAGLQDNTVCDMGVQPPECLPTNAPTRRPTRGPTRRPTAAPSLT